MLILGLGPSLFPLCSAFFVAYMIMPIIDRAQEKSVPRPLAIAMILTILFGLFILLISIIIPKLINEFINFGKYLPSAIDMFLDFIQNKINHYQLDVNIDKSKLVSLIANNLNKVSLNSFASIANYLTQMWGHFAYFIIGLLNLSLFSNIFMFHACLLPQINQLIIKSTPQKYQGSLIYWGQASHEIFQGFFRGQMSVALILTIYYTIMLTVIGLPFAIIVGVITGLFSIIPYIGFTLGISTSYILAFYSGGEPTILLLIGATFAVAYFVDNFCLTPYLVGNSVGLNSLTTTLALLIAGHNFGILGMIFAIPIAALIQKALKSTLKNYQQLCQNN